MPTRSPVRAMRRARRRRSREGGARLLLSAPRCRGLRSFPPFGPGRRPLDVPVQPRRTMSRVEQSIEIDVPVRTAYNQWTQFEEFPTFMEGVESVTQLDDTHLRWV